jgi:CBS domain-containing protein
MLGIHANDPIRLATLGVVATIEPSATLRQAAETLAAANLGLLVVVGRDGPKAVLSERDVVTAIAEGGDPDVDRVIDHATPQLVAVDEGATLTDAATAMRDAEVRHVLVRRGRHVIGVLSLRDVAATLLDDLAATA